LALVISAIARISEMVFWHSRKLSRIPRTSWELQARRERSAPDRGEYCTEHSSTQKDPSLYLRSPWIWTRGSDRGTF
jgi:hypothetical protein